MSAESLIADGRSYANSVLSSASSALSSAKSSIENVGYTVTSYEGTPLPEAPDTLDDLVAPTFDEIALDLPDEPSSAPIYQDIAELDPGIIPSLTAVAPSINLPNQPSSAADFTQVAPSISTNFSLPEPPGVLLNPMIDAPVLTDRLAPTAPGAISLPVFDAAMPIDTTSAPADLEGTFSSAYAQAAPSTIAMVNGYVDAMLTKNNPRYFEQMGRIETQLAKYLDGGTGVNAAVENAIYERARSKNEAETRRVRDASYADAAGRGFTLPSGALMASIQNSRQAGADNNAAAAREIVVMQAEMEQKNLQFAVTTSTGLRLSMLNASLSYMQNLISINGQALDYAKSILGAVIESYNTAVKVYGLKLDAYKAEASVFEVRLKSAMAGIELYRAEIAALEALTSVDKAKVDVYRARIDSLSAYANIYKAQIDAVLGRASLEKLKLDLFQVQVQAYTATVQGKNAEWQGYSAAISGETAKASLFRSQVDYFGAQITGYKAGIEAKSEVVRAAAATNRARADQYSATLSGYSAVVNARSDKARTQLENQRQEIVAFQAQSQAAVSKFQVKNEYYKAAAMVGIENAKLSLSTMFQSAESRMKYGASIAALAAQSATIHGQLAGSAMAGMNSLAAQIANE